jgi:uncharacterized Ntn-hydrolase superfamily protein
MDPVTKEIGGAVQSRVFSVGNGVLWAEAGVGAAATQAIVDVSYGRQALALLEQGLTAEQVVTRIWAADPDPRPQDWSKEGRQFAVIDTAGNVYAYTGPKATAWAGHKGCTAPGSHCTAQGNILAGAAVVDSMIAAYERSAGQHLSLRLLLALEAGQAAGGDARGQQSAAVVVEREGAAAERREGLDRVVDLRVDDHAEPIVELRRLYGIRERWEALERAAVHHRPGEYELGAALLREGLDSLGEDAVVLYDLACFEALAGQTSQAAAHLERALELDPGLRSSAERDPDLASLAGA